MSTSLASLKDIPGVFGSFVFSPNGTLIARDMPALYPDEVFAEVSRRISAISEAVEPTVSGFYELLAKFNGYWLLWRRTDAGALSVLADENVNFPALKMATNVAVKHLSELTVTPPAYPPILPSAPALTTATAPIPVAAPAPPPAPATPPAPAPAENRPRRVWRGQVVD